MTSIAVVVPIRSGNAEIWKERTRELISSRRAEVEDDWRTFGIRRSASWLQPTPQGDMAILYWDVDDPARLRARTETIMTSEREYYRDLRESLSDVFDLAPGQSRPASEPVADYRISAVENGYPRDQNNTNTAEQERSGAMPAVAVQFPIKPGKEETWKSCSARLMNPERGDVAADYQRYGIQRGASWLQQSPDGPRVILFWEVEDPEKIKERMADVMTSDDEFYVEMRGCIEDVFDTDRDQRPVSLPELVQDFHLPSPARSGGQDG